MGIKAIISAIPVQDEMKSFCIIAVPVFLPLLVSAPKLLPQHLVHLLRGFRRRGACGPSFLMGVGSEGYAAGACVRRHLKRIIQAIL